MLAGLAILLHLLLTSAAVAADFSGKVVSVLDGDIIEVLRHQHPERIRLNGIDCPEKGQAYGQKAKQATSALVFGKVVMLQTFGKDKYGRTLADVRLLDGAHVNHTLVKESWCWWYPKYALRNRELERLEKTHERRRKACGALPFMCHRGNGGIGKIVSRYRF